MSAVSLYSDLTKADKPERILDIRLVGSLSGCYSLESRKDAGDDVPKVFACRVQAISTYSAVLGCSVPGEVGERVSAKFDQFPVLTGSISRLFREGFVMDFTADEKARYEIAAKIDWIKKNRFKAERDKRHFKRIMPPNPHSAITLSDGRVLRCLVIDVSRSGVAVSADVIPTIGARLAVGRAVGTVVRHIEGGFALKLDELLDLDDLDPIFEWSLAYVKPEDLLNPDARQAAEAVGEVPTSSSRGAPSRPATGQPTFARRSEEPVAAASFGKN